MSFSVSRTVNIDDVNAYALPAGGATTVVESHIPFAAAVPPVLSAVGKGTVWVYCKFIAYDGAHAGGSSTQVFKVETGAPSVISDNVVARDLTVNATLNLAFDARGDLHFTVTNNAAGPVDVSVRDIEAVYLQP